MLLSRTTVKVLLAFVLAAALLLAQTLGMVHGVVHNSASDHAHVHSHSHTHADDHADEAAHEEGAFTSLFAVHDGEKDCRLYDQASQGGMLPLVVAVVFPVVPPPFEVAIFQGKELARWAALFDARGPPLTV